MTTSCAGRSWSGGSREAQSATWRRGSWGWVKSEVGTLCGMSGDEATECVVIALASSGARFEEGAGWRVSGLPGDLGPIEVSFRTRYADEGFACLIPRELSAEIRGPARSLSEALDLFTEAARSVVPLIVVATNAPIEDLEGTLAFELRASGDEHPFYERFVRDPVGSLPRSSRRTAPELIDALAEGLLAQPLNDQERLNRAMEHYRQAMINYRPGRQLSVVSHLWMAMEALTPVVKRRELGPGETVDCLAARWGIEKKEVDPQLRARILFAGDTATYRTAKNVSDALEHSTATFASLHADADAVKDALAGHVRRALVELSGVSASANERLLAPPFDLPRESFPMTKQVWGSVVGPLEKALQTGDVPYLRWESRISAITRQEEGVYHITPAETMTAVSPPEVQLRPARFEVLGPRQDSGRSQDTSGAG
jgi:hypothetical protein